MPRNSMIKLHKRYESTETCSKSFRRTEKNNFIILNLFINFETPKNFDMK